MTHILHQQVQSAPTTKSIRLRTTAAVLTVVGASLLAAPGCSGEFDAEEEFGEVSQSSICGGDNRVEIRTLSAPNAAIGRVVSPAGYCSGTLIAPNKVLTATHCIEGVQTSDIDFYPQLGIATPFTGPGPYSAKRSVQGMAWDFSEGTMVPADDWAILTLNQSLQNELATYGEVPIVGFTAQSRDGVSSRGYPGDKYDATGRPSVDAWCRVIRNDPLGLLGRAGMYADCDVMDGASGGPVIYNGSIIGVNSGHASQGCSLGNEMATSLKFVAAPDRAEGLAISHTSEGKARVWASDSDWKRISFRDQTKLQLGSLDFDPWQLNSSQVGGARKMGATNLEDGRQVIWLVNSSGQLWQRWENTAGGSWSGWSVQPTPTTVKDVAATGGRGNRTQLFVLGTDNKLYTTQKTGGASSSWSSWSQIGQAGQGKGIDAVRWNGMSVVFVADWGSGVSHAWGNGSSFSSLVSLGGGRYPADVSAVLIQDGRIQVQATRKNGTVATSIRGDQSWSSWVTLNASQHYLANSFIQIAAGKLVDGRAMLFAIADNREVYYLPEVWGKPGVYATLWKRFYV